MKQVVVDTSVIMAIIANEPEKEILIKLMAEIDLIAPYSVHWEVGNAITKRFKRKLWQLEDARNAMAMYQEISVLFVDVNVTESLKIAYRFNSYAYDAYVVQCAFNYQIPLISLDKGLIQLAKQMNVTVMEVVL